MEKVLENYELEVKTKTLLKLKKELIDIKYELKTKHPMEDSELIKYLEEDMKRLEKTIAELEA